MHISPRYFILSVSIFCWTGVFAVGSSSFGDTYTSKKMYAPLNHDSVIRDALKSLGSNALDLQRELIRWDSFKIVVGIFPFIVGARMIDDPINHCFINRAEHKDINQMDEFFHQFAQYGFVFPVFMGASLSLAARDPDVRFTSRMFMTGFPFVYISKEIIKKFDSGKIVLRPWREGYSRCKRVSGGFPSGHLAMYTYAAVLYGKRFGWKYAVPLGALTALCGIAFLNCNRHYASQIVGGVGLGALWAYATDKVVSKRFNNDDFSMGVALNSYNKPALTLACSF